MFDLSDKRDIWLPVAWNVLVSDGNSDAKPIEFNIRLRANLIDVPDWIVEFEPVREDPTSKNGFDAVSRLFHLTVSDWTGINDKGAPVAFSTENATRLLAKPGFSVAFFRAYNLAVSGIVETRSGNSDAAPASGPQGAAPSPTPAS
jgi:hypothetical protein